MVLLPIDFIGTGPDKTFMEIQPLSHKVQKGPHCFLHFSKMSLGAPGFNSNPRLNQQFMSKGLYESSLYIT